MATPRAFETVDKRVGRSNGSRRLRDLHLEVSGRGLHRKDKRFALPMSEADQHRLLVLAGDIDIGERACDLAIGVAEGFRAVVLVPGNYEY